MTDTAGRYSIRNLFGRSDRGALSRQENDTHKGDALAEELDTARAELQQAEKRAQEAERRAEAMERAMESTAADALRHRGCHRDLMAQCQRAEKTEATITSVRALADRWSNALGIDKTYARALLAALDGQAATPQGLSAYLKSHGDPIDIGWVNGRLDARLHLAVHPEMDPTEREQLLADLRDTIGALVPVRPTSQGART
jgi:hypothetical protein